MTLLLLIITATLSFNWVKKIGLRHFILTIFKVVLISNLSKFFLLPILIWRNNTTVFGRSLHHVLVMGHHFFSLILAYESIVVRRKTLRWLGIILVILAFVLKEYLRQYTAFLMEVNIM